MHFYGDYGLRPVTTLHMYNPLSVLALFWQLRSMCGMRPMRLGFYYITVSNIHLYVTDTNIFLGRPSGDTSWTLFLRFPVIHVCVRETI